MEREAHLTGARQELVQTLEAKVMKRAKKVHPLDRAALVDLVREEIEDFKAGRIQKLSLRAELACLLGVHEKTVTISLQALPPDLKGLRLKERMHQNSIRAQRIDKATFTQLGRIGGLAVSPEARKRGVVRRKNKIRENKGFLFSEMADPLLSRGADHKEVVGWTKIPYVTSKNQRYKLRRSGPGSIDTDSRKHIIAAEPKKDENTTAFLNCLLKARFVSVSTQGWRRLAEKCKGLGTPLADSFEDAICFEAYLEARMAAEKGDNSLIEIYDRAGEQIDPLWFQQKLDTYEKKRFLYQKTIDDEIYARFPDFANPAPLSPLADEIDSTYQPPKDIIDLYLRDASREPLLTAEEEVSLAKACESGREAARSLTDPDYLLTAEDKKALEEVRRIGDAARSRLYEANLKLVVAVAKKYIKRGLHLLDLCQEGNIGLMRAVEKYDWRRGYKFSTYAYWYIKQAVTRAIADQARTIRNPVYIEDAIDVLRRHTQALQIELEREPTDEELAEVGILGIYSVKNIQMLKSASLPTVSLETPIRIGEQDTTLADVLPDSKGPQITEVVEKDLLRDLLKKELQNALDGLTSRERGMLMSRYGLDDDGQELTLSEIGKRVGLTGERVRQIVGEALKKLRHPKFAHLRDYLD